MLIMLVRSEGLHTTATEPALKSGFTDRPYTRPLPNTLRRFEGRDGGRRPRPTGAGAAKKRRT